MRIICLLNRPEDDHPEPQNCKSHMNNSTNVRNFITEYDVGGPPEMKDLKLQDSHDCLKRGCKISSQSGEDRWVSRGRSGRKSTTGTRERFGFIQSQEITPTLCCYTKQCLH